MGATAGVSEPILFSVALPRLVPLLLLLGSLGAAFPLARLLIGPRLPGKGPALLARRLLGLVLLGLGVLGLWAAVQLASPPVLLKATERGLTSYMTAPNGGGGIRLQMARHAETDGLFIPWRAMESLRLDAVDCSPGGHVTRCDVLAIALRPGFEELRHGGVVVAPGGWRSSLDLPVPNPPGGQVLLQELRALQQRFAGR
jgi:hypothetical protein